MIKKLARSLMRAGLKILIAVLREAMSCQADPKNQQAADDAIVTTGQLTANVLSEKLPAYARPFVKMLASDFVLRPLAHEITEAAEELVKQALKTAEELSNQPDKQ